MPYKNTDELPEAVKDHLPKKAQEIYLGAFNSVWRSRSCNAIDKDNTAALEDCERVCHAIAWSAVKKKYEKNADGEWVKK